ncbi:hypothetical protein H0H87_008289 [Tephrocybe sp. NHM501043]|nr:hypothetical protein H0H87_008289 [Tephrocybe sp. NHM501043]
MPQRMLNNPAPPFWLKESNEPKYATLAKAKQSDRAKTRLWCSAGLILSNEVVIEAFSARLFSMSFAAERFRQIQFLTRGKKPRIHRYE